MPISHTLYLNDCQPTGCMVRPGFDDSRSDASSIADDLSYLPPYPHGAAHWDELVACVRETFAPFDIDVVTNDPGQASHFEVMVAGSLGDLISGQVPAAGGVAPFVGCNGSDDNVISFVFPEQSAAIPYLCAAVAQEAGHVWGLDHALDARDPMTYLELGSPKRFQNSEPPCGEATPRECYCGSETQNSFTYLRGLFGLAPGLALPTLQITAPADGARVKGGFRIDSQFDGPAAVKSLEIALDGEPIEPINARLGIYVGPSTLVPGTHTLTATAVDAAERTVVASITVTTAGALGDTCETVADCSTQWCASDVDESICTFSCDDATGCPADHYCRPTNSGSHVCWPNATPTDDGADAPDDGGCATSQPGAAMAIGALALVLRRRRR